MAKIYENIQKIIYLNCGERYEDMVDHRSYIHLFYHANLCAICKLLKILLVLLLKRKLITDTHSYFNSDNPLYMLNSEEPKIPRNSNLHPKILLTVLVQSGYNICIQCKRKCDFITLMRQKDMKFGGTKQDVFTKFSIGVCQNFFKYQGQDKVSYFL